MPVGGLLGKVSREVSMSDNPYRPADEKLLDEIIRQAEARLSAQLTCALASDQRSMSFASVLTTLAVGLFAGGVSLARDQTPMAIVAIMVSLTIAAASALIIWGARPILFCLLGNIPTNFIEDINQKKQLNDIKSEIAHHYNDMIDQNEKLMSKNSKLFRIAILIIAFAFISGASASFGIIIG